MKKNHCWLWAGWLLIGSPAIMAECLDDAECASGSQCFVARGYKNRCASQLPLIDIPGEVGRLRIPLSQRGGGGYPCQFNVDCSPGFACYKKNQAAIEGQCLQPPPKDQDSAS